MPYREQFIYCCPPERFQMFFKGAQPHDYLILPFQVEIEHQNLGIVQKPFHSSDLENHNKATDCLLTYLFYVEWKLRFVGLYFKNDKQRVMMKHFSKILQRIINWVSITMKTGELWCTERINKLKNMQYKLPPNQK